MVQAREVVICGLKGYKNKCERRQKAGDNFYRKAGKTLSTRVRKKLMEKTTWFKSKKKKEEMGSFKNIKGGEGSQVRPNQMEGTKQRGGRERQNQICDLCPAHKREQSGESPEGGRRGNEQNNWL